VRNDDGSLVSVLGCGERIDPASLEPSFRALIEQTGEIS
jgi:hypothetical protein